MSTPKDCSRISPWGAPILGLLLACPACQTPHYQAANLPDQLIAPSIGNKAQVQLSSFALAAPDSSLVAPGDVLDVTVETGLEEEPSKPHAIRVSQDGSADVPVVGLVSVAGMEPFDAGRAIRDASIARGLYRQPTVNVEVREKAVNKVTVLGAVKEPGVHDLPIASSSVVAAVAMAGGLTDEAGREVEVVRQRLPPFADQPPPLDGVVQASYTPSGGPVTERINLAQAEQLPPAKRSLGDGDVVMVLPKQKRVVYVSGLVNQPNEFEMPDDRDLRLLDAIAMAGGRSLAIADRVLVIRRKADGQPAFIRASVANAKKDGRENLTLAAGDLVSVESTAATTLADVAKNFLRVSLGVSSRLAAF